MTIESINEREKNEGQIYEIARQLRTLLDMAAKIQLPDGRDAAEEALAMATEE